MEDEDEDEDAHTCFPAPYYTIITKKLYVPIIQLSTISHYIHTTILIPFFFF